jgi:hypothetical protein
MASVCFSLLITSKPASARILDGGVDPENLGKGDWIWSISHSVNKLNGAVPGVNDIPSLLSWEKNQGMSFVIVKAGTGSTNYPTQNAPQFTSNLVYQAHLQGLKIFAYTRSFGDDLPGEIAMATNCYNLGADGFIFDAEAEWESSRQGTQGPAKAIQMLSAVKAMYPNKFLGHSPLPYISLHSSFPYKEFGYYCDAVMPQCYWNYIGVTPDQMVIDMDREWRNWHNGLTGQWTNSIKPIAPIGQADITNVTPAEITAFANAVINDPTPVTPGGYKGMSWWDAHQHSAAQWPAIAAIQIGTPPAVPDIIVDNPAATVVGSWTTASSSADKYGADYRFKSAGTGAAYLHYVPNVVTPGTYKVYTMYPKGTNRSTNSAVTINYNGGSTLLRINQRILGGSWVYLGAYPFVAGTNGSVRISDNHTGSTNLVMADAIRLAYVPPPPVAPWDLTATAASGPVINLSWTDNSLDESEFVVSRSTTAGGPYTVIASVNGGVTSFADSALAASTTYYYVVRAANEAGNSANSNEASATSTDEVPDIIIDNPAATMAGTWSLGTGATDKFGANYRFKSQGTGAAYQQYTPVIFNAGDYQVYEWHPQGSNRSAGTPHIVTHTGGSTTIFVNQQSGGGRWNLIGTFNFAAGAAGGVRINDAFADAGQICMADAIKFAFVPPTPTPAAPSDLTATAIGSSQINLGWIDNSLDEDNFVVASSTTSGGPYSDTATLPANSTSFTDGGLVGDRTYYYVVRAVNAGGASDNSAEASATTLPVAPDAPTALTATAVSQTQVDLAWVDNSSNENNFVISRGSSSGGPYVDIAVLGTNVTAFSDTGLTANTAYYYVVRATNPGGSSYDSNEATATTLPLPPVAPTGLAAITVSSTQIDLSWMDNAANEAGFTVARSATAGGPYTDIANLPANTMSYSDTGLSADTTYFYVVRASNTGGISANSEEAAATTLPLPPVDPSGLVASTVSQTQIDLSWSDNSVNETSFVIAQSTTASGPYTDIATLPGDATSYSKTGLSSATTYYFVVRAVNAGGTSANSNEANATTLPNAPTAPSNFSVIAYSSTQINLAWADTSANEVSFIVARATVNVGPYTDIATLPADSISYNDTGLIPNTTYFYVVRASNTGGTSPNSAQASTTTFETDLLIDNKSALSVGLWSTGSSAVDKYGSDYRFKSGGTGAAYHQYTPYITEPGVYEVYEWHPQGGNRSTNAPHIITYDGGIYTNIVNQQVDGGNWNLLGAFTFAAGTAGNIKITDGFTGTNSVMADAIKLVRVLLPADPTGLTATGISGSEISLTWVDNATNELSYIIARSTTPEGPYTDIVTLAANVTSYTNTGLTPNTWYYYVVRATGVAGVSGNSAEASARTFSAPAVPSNLTATAINPTQISLTWTDNATNELGFIIARGTVSGGPYTDIVSRGANVTSFFDMNLNPNTIYYYVVRATNSIGSSGNSAQASTKTLPSPPSPPGGLIATTVSSSQINLVWTDNSPNEDAFVLARSTIVGGPYTDVATIAANVTSYSNTGLAANTRYYYVLRAINGGGSSPNSNEASATTYPNPPTAPSALVAIALSPSAIKLTWSDNATNETSFVVARAATSGGPFTDIATLGANATAYTNTALSASTTYYYVIRAANTGGPSVNSAEASAITLPAIPAGPSALTATALSATSIKLTWTDNATNEASIVVSRSTVSGGPYTDIATLGANTTVYTNTALSGNTMYYYVVRAVNAGGASANSAQANARTLAVADIIIDNPAATIAGNWTLTTSSTDKYGADYRYKGKGNGSAHLTFRPNIQIAGTYQVYEWHSAGSNRTTNAPIILSYSGGSRTNFVNQKVTGGQWVALGAPVNLAAGTNGFVRITDKFPEQGQMVIGDAIKFVYVP